MDSSRGRGSAGVIGVFVAACVSLCIWAGAAPPAGKAAAPRAKAKPKPFVPPDFPLQETAPDDPKRPGHRLPMPELKKKYAASDIVLKAKLSGWTRAMWKSDELGTFFVGDEIPFSVVIGDNSSRVFGSTKHGRDGGKLLTTVYWMDESGKKVLSEDAKAVKYACNCWGSYDLKLSVPSTAKTGRHRMRLVYVNARLKMKVARDLYFHVKNDGSWKADPVIDSARGKYPTVLILQNGRGCRPLGLSGYQGTTDTYMHSTHRVPDRNTDFVNYGGLIRFQLGRYGQSYRTLIRFDLAGIPAGAEVKEAWLQVYVCAVPGRNGRPPEVAAYDVLKDWGAGRGNGSRWVKKPVMGGEASWLSHQHPAKWGAPGCSAPGVDRSAEPVGQAPRLKGKKGWVTIPLDAKLVGRWITQPATNHGLLLVDKNEGVKGGGYAHYRSSEFEDVAMRPRLILASRSTIAAGAVCAPTTCPTP